LHPVLDKFPSDKSIPYKLACYKCQAGDLMEAKEWLERALAVRPDAPVDLTRLDSPVSLSSTPSLFRGFQLSILQNPRCAGRTEAMPGVSGYTP